MNVLHQRVRLNISATMVQTLQGPGSLYANTHESYKAESFYWESRESLISPANFTSFDRE